MSTQPVLQPRPTPPPYEGFDWGGLTQICQALRHPDVSDRLFVGPLSFDQLAWAPRRNGRPMGALDIEGLRERLQYFFASHGQKSWKATTEEVARAVAIVARENPHHPVRARLCGLRWDGEPRLARVATEVLQVDAPSSPHAAALVRKWFLAAVARAFEPGCPADAVLTLVSHAPGAGAFFRLLVPPSEHADLAAPSGLDAPPQLRESWIWQRNDLPALAESDPDAVAALLQRRDDPSAAFLADDGERAPRTTLFVAHVATFPDLPDEALRRRFWLIPCGEPDSAKLTVWADQLWAEAATEYLTGTVWTLTPEEAAGVSRDHRLLAEHDPWEPQILDYFAKRQGYAPAGHWPSMAQILMEGLHLKPAEAGRSAQRRAGAILRGLGFESSRIRVKAVRRQIWSPGPTARLEAESGET